MSLTGIIILSVLWLGVGIWLFILIRNSIKRKTKKKETKDFVEEQIAPETKPTIEVEIKEKPASEEKVSDVRRKLLFAKVLPEVSDFKAQRLKLGLSQKGTCRLAGLSHATVCQVEKSLNLKYSTAQKLVSVYYKDSLNSLPSLYSLSKEFRKIRKERNLEISDIVKETEISWNTINDIENIKRNSDVDFFYPIVKRLFEFYKKELNKID